MIRFIIAAFLALCIAVWLVRGHHIVETVTHEQPTQAWASNALQHYQQTDPNIAQLIEQSQQELAQLQSLHVIDHALGETGLREIVQDRTAGHDNALQLITQLGLNQQHFNSPEDRQAFVQSYGLLFAHLRQNGLEQSPQLTQLLQTHARTPEAWQFFQADPIGLLVWDSVADPELRQFYLTQRDWLAEVLAQLTPAADTLDPYDLSPLREMIHSTIHAAATFHPLPQQAYQLEESDIIGFTLFLPTPEQTPGLGGLIQSLVQQGVPLVEALAVCAANADFLLEKQQANGINGTANYLLRLYQTRRMVWEQAQTYPLALQADYELPGLSEPLLKRYGDKGVLEFLYIWYYDIERPRLLTHAAQALVKYEDLAVFQLTRGKEDPRFLSLLTQDFRIVPYAAVRGDAALDQVLTEPEWLDKHFQTDGSPREAAWWSAVPIVGGPVHLLKELLGGHPVTWGEFGWATLDVIDGALLIASFGTSSALSATKASAKAGTKVTTQRILQNRARYAMANATNRSFAHSTGRHFMQRSLTRMTGNVVTRNSIYFLRWSTAAIAQGGKTAVQIGRNTLIRWQSLSPTLRRVAYRSVLAIGLWETWTHRTWPMLQEEGATLPARLLDATIDVAQATVNAIADAIDEQLLNLIGFNDTLRTQIGFWLVLAILLVPLLLLLIPISRLFNIRRWRVA